MAKIKNRFVCNQCGAFSIKWVGHCPSCESWNSYVEDFYTASVSKSRFSSAKEAILLQDISTGEYERIRTADPELDRVLGGGIVPGSLILLAGTPGIGKSTLLLQVLLGTTRSTLYIAAEESLQQIAMRADRIGNQESRLKIFAGQRLEEIESIIAGEEPQLVVVDSVQAIQTQAVDSLSGSVSQIRYVTEVFQQLAKEKDLSILLIGHITKGGQIAGPKLLEHIVDVVLQFEGEKTNNYRILRALKNRFGSVMELGIYEMKGHGLLPVQNPSDIMISQSSEDLSGSCICATLEGMRPFMVEVQALVSTSVYSTPQRSSTGFDLRRLHMLLAVLEKRGGMPFFKHDVFLNIAGGLRLTDPALDLPVAVSLASSLYDIPVPRSYCFAGEIGLSGEVRTVNFVEKRIQEATRLGMERIFLSDFTKRLDDMDPKIQLVRIRKLHDLFEDLFS